MLKLKYYSLTKDEKKQLKEKFYKTESGQKISKRLNRLFLTGIISFIYSIILFIINKNIFDITTGIILLIASFIFILSSIFIKINKLNDFLVKQKKK